jgi:hypothetical protein
MMENACINPRCGYLVPAETGDICTKCGTSQSYEKYVVWLLKELDNKNEEIRSLQHLKEN